MSRIANLSDGARHDHVLGVYDRDEALIGAVARFVAEALDQGGAAVVIAAAVHRRAIDTALRARGFELEPMLAAGRYQAIDAADTLGTFMRDGHIDHHEFASVVDTVLGRAGAAGRPVSVFGEMVGLLWDEGNVTAAIELESLWNEVGERHTFALFCAYAMSTLDSSDDLGAVRGMCDCHSNVFPLREAACAVVEPMVVAGRDEYDRMFVGSPASLRDVRRFVRDVMRAWDENDLRDVVEVLASEMATNAVQHARSPFRLSISRAPSLIRIAVRDTSFSPPEQLYGDTARLGGRGVRLVAALSRAWGSHDEPDGKTVWAEVARARRG